MWTKDRINWKFQSTPPRGRRLYRIAKADCEDGISIHASAREATLPFFISALAIKFQSTPPRGRRQLERALRVLRLYFNPRLREGGDGSTHDCTKEYGDFNPRLREGGDFPALVFLTLRPNFNPRLREGGDPQPDAASATIIISIHASAREATSSIVIGTMTSCISIHASAREATHLNTRFSIRISISIHASAREATEKAKQRMREGKISIHASAREATGRTAAE